MHAGALFPPLAREITTRHILHCDTNYNDGDDDHDDDSDCVQWFRLQIKIK